MSSGAIGVLETRGMASLMAATDAMLKAADVQLCGRHGIGSGWLTVVIAGRVADVEAALGVGEVEANRTGELIGVHVVPRPAASAMDAMPHAMGLGTEQVPPRAIGLLETQGLTPLVAGADAMLKAAQVELGGWAFIGGALCHAPVFGDVATVQTALAAGRQAAERLGTVYATLVLPQPSEGLGPLVPTAPTAAPRSTGALGLIETIGYAAVVGSADAMLKAADVQIERLSIGSGGRIAALATGQLDDVQAAVCAGAEAATALGQLDAAAVVSRPDPVLVARFATTAEGLGPGARQALGLIETRSTVALVRAVDRMLKAAAVEYEGAYKVGYYLTAAVVRGDVGAVQVAIDAGREEAVAHGEQVSAYGQARGPAPTEDLVSAYAIRGAGQARGPAPTEDLVSAYAIRGAGQAQGPAPTEDLVSAYAIPQGQAPVPAPTPTGDLVSTYVIPQPYSGLEGRLPHV